MGGERVQIIDPDHPHFPEHGVFVGKVIRMRYGGQHMALVKLDNCQHGVDECFVSAGQITREVVRARPTRKTRTR